MTAAISSAVLVLAVALAWNARTAADLGLPGLARMAVGVAVLVAALVPVFVVACRTEDRHPLAHIRKERNR